MSYSAHWMKKGGQVNVAEFHTNRSYQKILQNPRNLLFSSRRVDKSNAPFCRSLYLGSTEIFTFEVSEDGNYFVIVGREWEQNGDDDDSNASIKTDGYVKLCSIDQALTSQEECPPVSPVLEYQLEESDNINCVAISPNNNLIVAGCDGTIFVNDVETAEEMWKDCWAKGAFCVAMQPGSQGQVSAAGLDKVRLYDIRTDKPIVEMTTGDKSPKIMWVLSLAFSPIEPELIACAGIQGTEIFDIRQPSKVLQAYPIEENTMCVQFNPTGNRLLCFQGNSNSHFVHDLFRPGESVELKMHYSTQSCTNEGDSACFVGISADQQDELVAVGSDRGIFIYSVPRGPFEGQFEIEKPLFSLTSRPKGYRHVRYNPTIGAFISYGVNDRINFDEVPIIKNEEPFVSD